MSNIINFEDSLKRLEEITDVLENGNLSLEDSLKIFEEGIGLTRYCEQKLMEVEQKIEILKTTEIPIQNDFSIKDIDINDPDESKKQEKKQKKAKKINLTTEEEDNLLF